MSPARLRRCRIRKLRKLTLYRCDTVDNRVIKELAHLASLEELRLIGCRSIDDTAVEHLIALQGLKQLGLAQTGISQPGLDRIRAALPECRVYGR